MRRRKNGVSKAVKHVCIIAIVSFIIVIQIIIIIIISAIQLKKTPPSPKRKAPKIGEFGEAVIGMLPSDLAFTLFLPSEEAFRRDLGLDRNDGNAHATLTRVLGFSAVPRRIAVADLEWAKQRTYESISGFDLHVSKDSNGMVVANGVVSEAVGLKMGNVLVHVMNGVVMDAEFQESVQPEPNENNDRDEERKR